jgi:hypothetical protein
MTNPAAILAAARLCVEQGVHYSLTNLERNGLARSDAYRHALTIDNFVAARELPRWDFEERRYCKIRARGRPALGSRNGKLDRPKRPCDVRQAEQAKSPHAVKTMMRRPAAEEPKKPLMPTGNDGAWKRILADPPKLPEMDAKRESLQFRVPKPKPKKPRRMTAAQRKAFEQPPYVYLDPVPGGNKI